MTTRRKRRAPAFLWRKLIDPTQIDVYEAALRDRAGHRLAIIWRLQRRRILCEVSCKSWTEAQNLKELFGGRIEKLLPDWSKRFGRLQGTKPIKVAGRELIIPGEAAFGTGEHATTAMCLHLLKRAVSLCEKGANRGHHPRLVMDLGTGTGILALAARILGAQRVVGIDHDPIAISIAKENARRNKIGNVSFRLADARRWRLPRLTKIVIANLFSELLIEILPRLKRACWLILSGILREQEPQVVRALKQSRIEIVEIRRRGKWIAILVGQKTDLRA
jgi:ribosomal protein L11 methyltransferase